MYRNEARRPAIEEVLATSPIQRIWPREAHERLGTVRSQPAVSRNGSTQRNWTETLDEVAYAPRAGCAGSITCCMHPFRLLVRRLDSSLLGFAPTLEPTPSRTDAIIELGGPGDRDGAALSLARRNLHPIGQSTTELEAGTNLCLPTTAGVTVLCFSPDPGTTRGEARSIAQLALQYRWDSVILVTSTDQALRARLRVSRCFPGDVYVSTTPPPVIDWLYLVPYQWAAFVKALFIETTC